MIRSTLFSFGNLRFLVPALFLAACAQAPEEAADSHGGTDSPAVTGEAAAPSAAGSTDANAATYGTPPAEGSMALTPAALVAQAEALDGQTVLVEGTVTQVCQMAGCWLKLQNEAGEDIRVNVDKDEAGEYAYTFPMDIAGARLVLEGALAVEETPVETLRHLAEDEGQTPEQVAAITAPKREVILTATGARVLTAPAQS